MSRAGRPRVAVVGAGLLGTTTALLLQRAGISVDLFDSRPAIWQGATATGEGKIHLGYVYALGQDDTVDGIIAGALSFDAVVERALGRSVDWSGLTSEGFVYVVHPHSLADATEVGEHYARVHRLIDGLAARDDRATYLGTPVRALDHPRECRVGPSGHRGFATKERAVDVMRLYGLFERALAASGAAVRLEHQVVDVDRSDDGWRLVLRHRGGEQVSEPFAAVVNATWDQQERLNRRAVPDGHWGEANYRLRAFVDGRSQHPMPAYTIVQGPFGDTVGFDDGRFYASWYPAGLLGFTAGTEPPQEWDGLTGGVLETDTLGQRIMAELGAVVPLSPRVDHLVVKARVVVAEGDTDIDQRDSRLHDRLGPSLTNCDGWVIPRNYKLTSAPAAAAEACELVRGLLS